MKRDEIQSLTSIFEAHAQHTETGVEFWLARDVQYLLDYAEWRNFLSVIDRAVTACEITGYARSDHFVDVNKMVSIGSGGQREIEDIMLSRFACYLIAQNADPGKTPVAFAQSYFALQTRRAEVIEQRIDEIERLNARRKLTETEKELSQVIFEQTGDTTSLGYIRAKGDKALFNRTTKEMKSVWNVPATRPLADFAPTIILKAKDFAAEITVYNSREHGYRGSGDIADEHVANNAAIRQVLLERGIRPESVSPAEDVKKVERRLDSADKKSLGEPEPLA